ncbi:hypothetical protein AB7278_25640, partial [Escherichia coli]
DKDIITQNPYVKSVTYARAYTEEQIASKWGHHTGCHSTINAMFGMFTAINTQISIIKVLPDYNTYSHVLRIRTDCALFIKKISKSQLNDKILVAKNYSIPNSWISDHLMLTSIDKFNAIWGYSNINEFAKDFDSAGRNPEKMLADRIKKLNYSKLLSEAWVRGEDYHIVYNPAKEDDPCHIKYVLNKYGIEALFEYTLSKEDIENVRIINKHWHNSNKYYDTFYSKLKRYIKKMI